MNSSTAPTVGKIWFPICIAVLAVLLAAYYISRHRLSGENYEAFGIVALAAFVVLFCTARVLTMSVRAMAATQAGTAPNATLYRTAIFSGFAWCVAVVIFGAIAIFGLP